jgi:hypothetical protein
MNTSEPNHHYAAALASEFNRDLKRLVEAVRTTASMCERFTEQHGTDCGCVVCDQWQGASGPHETVEDVAFIREFLNRQLVPLEYKIIVSLPELLATLRG